MTTCNNIPWLNISFDHFGQLVNALESFLMWVVGGSFPIFSRLTLVRQIYIIIKIELFRSSVMDRDGWSGKFHLCSLVIKKLLQFQISL